MNASIIRVCGFVGCVWATLGCAANSEMGQDRDSSIDTDWETNTEPPTTDTGLPDPDWEDIKGPPTNSDPDDTDETDPDCDIPAGVYYLSCDDSNSMASPVLARSFLEAGQLVPQSAIRVHEFLNYYDLGEPRSDTNDLGLAIAARRTPIEDEHELLLVVSAPAPSAATRRPLSLTLSIDTSASMAGVPLALATSACQALARSLTDGDTLSIVTWSTTQSVLLDSWPITPAKTDVNGEPYDPQVDFKCGQLKAGGATDLHRGLVAAIELADRNASGETVSRVILLSDGRANAGFADVDTIATRARRTTGGEVLFMGVGLGTAASYRDSLMDIVTDAGKGAYVFLDSDAEAKRVFGKQLLRHVDVAAKNVSVSVRLPHGMGISRFHGEEYSQSPGQVEPQHLAADDAMAFHQIVRTCGEPDTTLLGAEISVTVEYTDPASLQKRDIQTTAVVGELLDALPAPSLSKASAVVAWAELLKNLPSDPTQAHGQIAAVRQLVSAATAQLGGDGDLQEIDGLLVQLDALID